MIGQKGPGRVYPGDLCYHENGNGRRDCKEPRCETSKGRSTLCKAHELERCRNSKNAYRARKRGEVVPVVDTSDPERLWLKEEGKPCDVCITPGCERLRYLDASRCSVCLNARKKIQRPRKTTVKALPPDESTLPRRVSSKPPVLPYAYRNFGWKGTLSEELRNSR